MEATITSRLLAAIEREIHALLASARVTPAQINAVWAREFREGGFEPCAGVSIGEGEGVGGEIIIAKSNDDDDNKKDGGDTEDRGREKMEGGIMNGDVDADVHGVGFRDGDGVEMEMGQVFMTEEKEKRREKEKEPTLFILDLLGPTLHDPSLGPRRGRILTAPESALFPTASSPATAATKPRVLVTEQFLPDGIVYVPGRRGNGGGSGESGARIYWTNMGLPPSMSRPGMQAMTGSVCFVELDVGGEGVSDEGGKGLGLGEVKVKVLVPAGTGGLRNPKQLTFAEEGGGGGYLYFCDREGMAVRRCGLDVRHGDGKGEKDGAGMVTLVQTGDPEKDRTDKFRWCVGVVVDPVRKHLYWSQKGGSKAGEGRICRVPSLEVPPPGTAGRREDIEVLFEGLPEPVDLELDVEAQVLSWTDRGEVPNGCSLNCAYVGSDERVRECFVGGLGAAERGMGYCVLVRMLHEPVVVKVDRRGKGGYVYVCDLGGCVYRFRLLMGELGDEERQGEGGRRMVSVGDRERASEYEGCFTGLALAYL